MPPTRPLLPQRMYQTHKGCWFGSKALTDMDTYSPRKCIDSTRLSFLYCLYYCSCCIDGLCSRFSSITTESPALRVPIFCHQFAWPIPEPTSSGTASAVAREDSPHHSIYSLAASCAFCFTISCLSFLFSLLELAS